MPERLEVGLDRLREDDAPASLLALAGHLGAQALGELEPDAGAGLAPRPHEAVPGDRVEALGEQQLDPRATRHPAREEPRREHARVVDHQQVARPQQVGELADRAVTRRVLRVEDEQPAGAARERPLRDPVRGQLEVEVADQHGASS
ncbi:MAG: hypothetical protein H6Q03_1715 [Acidobacteria bacterium]|nr:hypothetical protein [Acidobacteriota bacterium]